MVMGQFGDEDVDLFCYGYGVLWINTYNWLVVWTIFFHSVGNVIIPN